MKRIYPDHYHDFHCLAGQCPDTCCKGWQIIIDPDTLTWYRQLDGELGQRVRACLIEEDGEVRFGETDGRCALLTPDGLCALQCAYGEQALCKTCASHPRFIEQYGATEEYTLSISCPEAARLLLARSTPVTFLHDTDSRLPDGYNTLDPDLYHALDTARELVIRLCQDGRFSLCDRMSVLLLFAKRMQALIDDGALSHTPALLTQFSSDAYLHRQRVRLARMRGHSGTFLPLWLLLRNMEHLTNAFPPLLEAALHAQPERAFWEGMHTQSLENLLVYFLFRYFKKAVNDNKLLPRVSACVFHLLSIRQLYFAQPERTQDALIRLCSLYSKEVEHSEENMALLLRALARRTPSTRALLSIL